MKRTLRTLLAAGLAAAALPAAAQLGQPGLNRAQGRPQAARRPLAQNYLKQFTAAAEALGKRFGATVVVDPALYVSRKPMTGEPASLEKGLDALVAQARNAAWRRVYLAAGQSGSPPNPARLAAAVRALTQVEPAGIVLENPATRRATTFVKDFVVPENFAQELEAQSFSPAGICVIYSTLGDASGRSPQERLMDMQRQSMEMMLQMSPEELEQAMSQGMQMFMNMDPQTRTRLMGMQMRAGMQMFMRMSPEQRNELMQGVMQMFGGAGGPFGPGSPGGPGPRP